MRNVMADADNRRKVWNVYCLTPAGVVRDTPEPLSRDDAEAQALAAWADGYVAYVRREPRW